MKKLENYIKFMRTEKIDYTIR